MVLLTPLSRYHCTTIKTPSNKTFILLSLQFYSQVISVWLLFWRIKLLNGFNFFFKSNESYLSFQQRNVDHQRVLIYDAFNDICWAKERQDTSVIKGTAKKLKSQHSLNKLRQISNLLVEPCPFSLTLKYISQLFNFFLD